MRGERSSRRKGPARLDFSWEEIWVGAEAYEMPPYPWNPPLRQAYAHLPINARWELELRVDVIQNLGSVPCRRDMRLSYHDSETESYRYHWPGPKLPHVQVLFRCPSPSLLDWGFSTSHNFYVEALRMLPLDGVLIESSYWPAVSASLKKGGGSCLLQDNETNKPHVCFSAPSKLASNLHLAIETMNTTSNTNTDPTLVPLAMFHLTASPTFDNPFQCCVPWSQDRDWDQR